MGTALPPVRLSFTDHNLRSLCAASSHALATLSLTIMSGVAVVFCNAFALHGIGPPVLSSEGAVLHAFRGSGLACLGASSPFYGHSMSLEQAIMRLELCMFELGGIWTGSFGRFTPHLCLIPSMHDS